VLVARRPRGSAPFGRREATLARSLVRQVEPWLALPDVAGGGSGAAARTQRLEPDTNTARALALLRESSRRLGRLAEATGPDMAPDAAVPALLDEVHAVERAVASLIGAVALAADTEEPAPGVSSAELPPAGPPGELPPAGPPGELPEVSTGLVWPVGQHVPGPRRSGDTVSHIRHVRGRAGNGASGPDRPAWTTTGTKP